MRLAAVLEKPGVANSVTDVWLQSSAALAFRGALTGRTTALVDDTIR